MNLTRLGHFFHPHASGPDKKLRGSCQTALVVGMNEKDNEVNLAVWGKDGDTFRRLDVPVQDAGEALHPRDGGDTFHLSMDCPWRR
jgi:hypothetical protein